MKNDTPIISVVGYSDAGKTTYLERLIHELVNRGIRVSAVKHDVHGFEMDTPGKDSYRLKHAGASMAIISSPKKVAVIADADHDMSLVEIRERFISNVDLIISEGYKRDIHPKIEVFRGGVKGEAGEGIREKLLCGQGDNLFAVVSDTVVKTSVPVFDLEDAKGMALYIEKEILIPCILDVAQEKDVKK